MYFFILLTVIETNTGLSAMIPGDSAVNMEWTYKCQKRVVEGKSTHSSTKEFPNLI